MIRQVQLCTLVYHYRHYRTPRHCYFLPVPLQWCLGRQRPQAADSFFDANNSHLESNTISHGRTLPNQCEVLCKKTLNLCNSCFWPSQVWLLKLILTWDSIMSAWLSKSREEGFIWIKRRLSLFLYLYTVQNFELYNLTHSDKFFTYSWYTNDLWQVIHKWT